MIQNLSSVTMGLFRSSLKIISQPISLKKIEFSIRKKQKILYRQAGGSVLFDRVGGMLAVSRAFGDFALESSGLICTPHV